MKYIITESQYLKLKDENIEHLKKPMFKYWDTHGIKNLKDVKKLFDIHASKSNLIEEWLLEWMGGEEELYKILDKYQGRILSAEAGTYNFKFYIDNMKIYTHGEIEIYFDAYVDGDGQVLITKDDGTVINNIYDADIDDDIGWEVDGEIRDTIVETLEDITDLDFRISIDQIIVSEPGKFNN